MLPILTAAWYSSAWIGWWSAIPIVLVIAWIFVNPRAFPPPKSTRNWCSKGVLGERVWLHRKSVAVPEYHHTAPGRLNVIAALGSLTYFIELTNFHLWATISGMAVIMLAKLWFFDRMVWLWQDMRTHEAFRSWDY